MSSDTPATDDPSYAEALTPTRRPVPWWLAAVAGAAVVAVVGGVVVGVRALSGGGSQPEDVLPAGAFAFAKLDLDPPAGQKVDAVRFLRRFPSAKAKVSEDSDLRRVAFEAVADDAGWGDLDFAKDVEPWLGRRIGVAGYGPDGKTDDSGVFGTVRDPKVVVALQVTDEAAARAGLDRLIRVSPGENKPGYVIVDGYALLAESTDEAELAAADAESSALADAKGFAGDVAALEDGVAAAWIDADAANRELGLDRTADMGLPGLPGLAGLPGLPAIAGSGRSTYVLRFDGPDALEVTGRLTGAESVAGLRRPVQGMGDLPASSIVALGLSGGRELVEAFFAALDKAPRTGDGPTFADSVAQAEQELGLDLPDDLAVLLGSNIVASLQAEKGEDGVLEVGARSTTDAARAGAVLDKMERAARQHGTNQPLLRRQTEDGIVVATTADQADRLAGKLAGKGGLGQSKAFRRALPDVDEAGFALWVDVRGLARTFFPDDGSVDADLEPIAGIGMTAVSDGKGSATYRVRLVTE